MGWKWVFLFLGRQGEEQGHKFACRTPKKAPWLLRGQRQEGEGLGQGGCAGGPQMAKAQFWDPRQASPCGDTAL